MEDITTILVVDDSLLARKMVASFASEVCPDAVIIAAASGQEALQKLEGATFQAATIDYNMPGMDGLTLAEQLRREHPHARMALLTANIQDAVAQRAANLGLEFICKPVTEESISAFLRGKGGSSCSS